MTEDEFEALTRVLVPFSYGAFEQHGSDAFPFEPGKPNAHAYEAVRALLAALPAPATGGEADWSVEFAKHRGWSLSFDGKHFGEDDNTEMWCVHEVRGNINDREWNVIGLGETPAIAVAMAYRTQAARTAAGQSK